MTVQTFRRHSAQDVDWTRAKSGCRYCAGRGYIGWTTLPDAIRARVVCRCVIKRGGVKKASASIPQPPFHVSLRSEEELVADRVRALPPEQREATIQRLQAAAADDKTDPIHRARLRVVLGMLSHPTEDER